MSPEPAAGVLAAAACGIAGLGVPVLVGSLPGPAGEVAAVPGLRWRAALLAAAAGAVVGVSLGWEWALLVLLPLVPVEVALGLVDRHTHLLPTRLIWPSLVVAAVLAGVAALLSGDGGAIVGAVVGGLGSLVVFHALWWVYPDGMGYGDVRLATLVGFQLGFLGAAELLTGAYAGFALFALVGIGRGVRHRRWAAMREPLPFGPFLLVGALVGVVVGAYLASG
jgi:leader peptidase (prepilin peptidase) / N-methyltransferase